MALQAVQVSRQGTRCYWQARSCSRFCQFVKSQWFLTVLSFYGSQARPYLIHPPPALHLPCLQLKIRHGPTFGTAKEGSRHLFELLAARGRRLALVAPRELLMLHAVPQAEVVLASGDRQAVVAALAVLGVQQGGRAVGAAAAPTAPGEHAAHPAIQQRQAKQQGGQGQRQGQQRQPPPDLLWLHMGELWRHWEEEAQQLAAQVISTGAAGMSSSSCCEP